MFTVIIPVHNKLPHLERSIHSVLNQTFREFELILIDDASSDGSTDKLKQFNDQRIKILTRSTPGPGGYAARNLGITNAKFEWISFLDADDEWDREYLNKVAETIKGFQNADFITVGYDNIYNSGKVKKNPNLNYSSGYTRFGLVDFFNNNSLVWTGVVNVKKTLIIEAGMFPESRCKRGGDMDTWIRCLANSSGAVRLNQILAHYYRDTVNKVTDIRNTTNEICSEYTINSMIENCKDKKLLDSIDVFFAKQAYSSNLALIYSSRPIKLASFKKIRSYRKKTLVLTKLLGHSFLFKLKCIY